MEYFMRKLAILLLALGLIPLCEAQKPNLSNAKIQELSAASGLKPVFDSILQKQDSPAWIGYRIPSVPLEGMMCCFDSWGGSRNDRNHCCSGCNLEREKGESFGRTISDCSPPEPFHDSFVFFRVENRQISKIRNFSPNCPLDLANLPFYWLENVNPAQSIALLMDLAITSPEAQYDKRISNGAVAAIALHDDPAADTALEKLLQPDQRESVREDVVFWLGEERGKKGLEVLRKYAKADPSDRLRERITFALTLNKEPGAIPELISMARTDPSSRVRGQALFWMGQIGGRKEAEQITDAIENDPETEVKKRAVFSLAQMKNGEGVPLLINVAKTNRNPAVRKEAVRWLGMTNDPRALDFLEQLLTR
jgi:HEAT repeat protein